MEVDGTLAGPGDGAVAAVAACGRGDAGVRCIYSGGVGSLDDLRELRGTRRSTSLEGVIVGRALYEGRFTVAEGQAALERLTSIYGNCACQSRSNAPSWRPMAGTTPSFLARAKNVRWLALYETARMVYGTGSGLGQPRAVRAGEHRLPRAKSKGRRSNLTEGERNELWSLVKKAVTG